MKKTFNRLVSLLSLLPTALFIYAMTHRLQGQAAFSQPGHWLVLLCVLLGAAATLFSLRVLNSGGRLLFQTLVVLQGSIFSLEGLVLSSGPHPSAPDMPFYVQIAYSLVLLLATMLTHPRNTLPPQKIYAKGSYRAVRTDPATGATIIVNIENSSYGSSDDNDRHHHPPHHHSGTESHHHHSSTDSSSGDSGGGDSGGGDSGGGSSD